MSSSARLRAHHASLSTLTFREARLITSLLTAPSNIHVYHDDVVAAPRPDPPDSKGFEDFAASVSVGPVDGCERHDRSHAFPDKHPEEPEHYCRLDLLHRGWLDTARGPSVEEGVVTRHPLRLALRSAGVRSAYVKCFVLALYSKIKTVPCPE